jgi:hypothetical protein
MKTESDIIIIKSLIENASCKPEVNILCSMVPPIFLKVLFV